MSTTNNFPLHDLISINGRARQANHLDLIIPARSVGIYSEPTSDSGSDPVQPTEYPDFVHLLSGPLPYFMRYSGQENAKWLMDIARDICDPRAMRGSLSIWDDAQHQWCPVAPADPLTASIYCYILPLGTTVGLTQISMRAGRSKTGSVGPAVTMRHNVLQRDGRCWVTSLLGPLANAHIFPKRMGDHLARRVFVDFFPTLASRPDQSIFDNIFGLALSRTVEYFFAKYEVGFRFVDSGQYKCHVFGSENPDLIHTIYGVMDAQTGPATLPLLHGHPASPPQPLHVDNPPAGLFRWHYLQCVIRKFAHDDYKNLANIKYPELPVRLEGDSDDEGTDSEADWPSAALDRGRALLTAQEDVRERRSAVTDWVAEV
ncbi:hypothetical protein FB451DRAFT_1064958 [Mycena latifolia]|nr:hypothetical protein FB451DRAFT_1064958 [Mycena latifolia]